MKQKLIYATAVIVVFGGILLVYSYYALFGNNLTVKDDGILYIKESDDYQTVLSRLNEKGYLQNSSSFHWVARLKRYPEFIKKGRYRIEDGMSNVKLINRLRRGDQEAINFTFNNIRNIHEFARIAQQQLEVDSSALIQKLTDSLYLQSMELTPQSVTVILLPNTYQINWLPTTEQLIERFNKEYKRFWNKSRRAKAIRMGLTPIEVTTLASIIEEETIQPKEFPIIAGVYMNRLQKGIPLSACPTIKYALNDFGLQRILTKHLKIDSPYNTYQKTGLPPGPIRIASTQVIDGVLNYTKHDYLYFCAKSDLSGGHHFSKTLSQHNRYAREYHNVLNRRRIYK